LRKALQNDYASQKTLAELKKEKEKEQKMKAFQDEIKKEREKEKIRKEKAIFDQNKFLKVEKYLSENENKKIKYSDKFMDTHSFLHLN
jgi:hypothetical protein